MTVKIELMRDEAEALYDAAIYQMRNGPLRAHLWEAAWGLRVACGMHHASSTPEKDAMDAVKADIEREGNME